MAEPSPQSFRLAISQAKKVTFTLDALPAASVAAWHMAFYLRRKGGGLLVSKVTGSGITCTDPDVGTWEVAITEEDSTDADKINGKVGLYDWSFWRTDDGSETPLAVGTCQVYRTSRTQ